jgi:hypothetical protein
VLLHRRREPLTPLRADGFETELHTAGLSARYPTLVSGLRHGFDAGFPNISCTYTPPNGASIHDDANIFQNLIDNEFHTRRWIGPFTRLDMEALLGPFQTSPCSLVEKPADPEKPDAPKKMRLIQNFSAPRIPRDGIRSINHDIDISVFPCTWGTPEATELLVWTLPPGSEMAVRDVASAYRNIPLHPSQWPSAVVRISQDEFAADTCGAFGAKSIGGVWGLVADASCDIMRARGIGPLDKWVDDYAFFRIPTRHIEEYNRRRQRVHAGITERDAGRPRQKRGHIWWEGATRSDGSVERWVEDLRFPLRDLSGASERTEHDRRFTYNLADIDRISSTLGIIWGEGKTRDFAPQNTQMGFVWDVQSGTVAISDAKRRKYLATIHAWKATGPTHDLEEAERLHGRLQHLCFIIPRGRAYLTTLQAFLGVYGSGGHHRSKHLTPPRRTANDLDWWSRRLETGNLSRPIREPRTVIDVGAFSDASSGVGVAVYIKGRWRAWRLVPGWKRDGRDIQWAEALGFEFLCSYVFGDAPVGTCARLWGDNTAVVEGWWRGRSANTPVNDVFKRVGTFLDERRCDAVTAYVESAHNPADEPSRGKHGPGTPYTHAKLLAPIPIPEPVRPFLRNLEDPLAPAELSARLHGRCSAAPKHIDRAQRRTQLDVLTELERTELDNWLRERAAPDEL